MKNTIIIICLMAGTALVSFGAESFVHEDEILTCDGGIFAENPLCSSVVNEHLNPIKDAAIPGALVMLVIGGTAFFGKKLKSKIKK